MHTVSIEEVDMQLRRLPPEKLLKVFEFASSLADDEESREAFLTMLASEDVLRQDWDTPEEDAAWAHL